MNMEQQITQILSDPIDQLKLDPSLSDDDIETLVQRLKDEADRHWYIDPNDSLQYAEKIITIGHYYENPTHIALGMMSKGDALRFLAKYDDAWNLLNQAGDRFLDIDDEIGWARTCIGRLAICIQVDRIEEAKADAQKAMQIFLHVKDYDKYTRLINNVIYVSIHQSNYHDVINTFQAIRQDDSIFQTLPPDRLDILYNNVGFAYFQIGDMRLAKKYYSASLAINKHDDNLLGLAITEANIAFVDLYQGRIRTALESFHTTTAVLKDKAPDYYVTYLVGTALCYVRLNRFEDVFDVCNAALDLARNMKYRQEIARLLTLLCIAYASRHLFDHALDTIKEATRIYREIESVRWVAYTLFLAAQIQYLREEYHAAQSTLDQVYQKIILGDDLQSCEIRMLQARIHVALAQYPDAISCLDKVLVSARSQSLLAIRYEAHNLFGNILKICNQERKAILHFLAATLATDKMQHQLTLTLRSNLVSDKINAFHFVINYFFDQQRIDLAFFHLQRIKTQVWLGFLSNLDDIHISDTEHASYVDLDLVNDLRREHHWLYQKINHPDGPEDGLQVTETPPNYLDRLKDIEKQLRTIFEKTSLGSHHRLTPHLLSDSILESLQTVLDREEILIEFYSDGEHIWAFVITDTDQVVTKIKVSIDQVETLIAKLQFNIDCALKTPSDSPVARHLKEIGCKLSQMLYQALFSELQDKVGNATRLYIVPFGSLHYIPFQILLSDESYLIASHEVVILPFSGYLLKNMRTYPNHSMILADTWNGRLNLSATEAKRVASLIDADVFVGSDCNRDAIDQKSGTILHLATHSEFRLDHPDLSYIYLNDGHFFTADLLQNRIRFELVVLSACETGRSHVTSGDDLVGVGHAFLYSGTSAVIASQWRVDEENTLNLMQDFYTFLRRGYSKAAALRLAQLAYINDYPDTHPAFWGAFQLLGSPKPIQSLI